MVGDASKSLSKPSPSRFIVPAPPRLQDRRPQSHPTSPALWRGRLRARRANVRLVPLTLRSIPRNYELTPAVAPGRLSPDAEPWSTRSSDRFCLRDVRIFRVRLSHLEDKIYRT